MATKLLKRWSDPLSEIDADTNSAILTISRIFDDDTASQAQKIESLKSIVAAVNVRIRALERRDTTR